VGGPSLDLWTSGPNEAATGAAVVAAGRGLAAWQHCVLSLPATAGSEAYVPWRLDLRQLERTAGRIVADLGLEPLLMVRPDAPFVPFLRLAVSGNVIPADVVPRLLQAPGVAAAALGATRPAGAMARLSWRWPLRIGLVGQGLVARAVLDAVR
jgi:hypothetical protein